MTSVAKAGTFLKTLGNELSRSTLTPAQASQIRRAAEILEGGTGITTDQIDKVGKELKLTGGQRAALRFAFLLERVQSTLGDGWRDAAGGAAGALKVIAQQTKTDPKVAAAVEGFIASLHGGERGTVIPGVKTSLEADGGALWVSGEPSGPRRTFADVTLLARGGNIALSFEDGAASVSIAHGRGNKRVPLNWLNATSLERLRTALGELTPKTGVERAFVNRALKELEREISAFDPTLPMTSSAGTSLPDLGNVRLKSPPAPKKKPHEDDPGAFHKDDTGWQFRPNEGGALGKPVHLDGLALESLLDMKDAIRLNHTGVDVLARADVDVDPAIVDLDGALTLAIVARQKSDRAASAAAEDRLRRALQGLPSTSLDREVFLNLVGGVTPKRV